MITFDTDFISCASVISTHYPQDVIYSVAVTWRRRLRSGSSSVLLLPATQPTIHSETEELMCGTVYNTLSLTARHLAVLFPGLQLHTTPKSAVNTSCIFINQPSIYNLSTLDTVCNTNLSDSCQFSYIQNNQSVKASDHRVFTVRRYALHGLCDRNSVHLSVRLSVCPSVTLVHCVHMVRPTIMISSPYGSPPSF